MDKGPADDLTAKHERLRRIGDPVQAAGAMFGEPIQTSGACAPSVIAALGRQLLHRRLVSLEVGIDLLHIVVVIERIE